MSGMYNFPSTTPNKKGMTSLKNLDSSFDKDILFSPTNSMSESGTPKKKYDFNFDDVGPSKKGDYLANITANSADLEDSILGELLGGGGGGVKKPSSRNTSAKTSSTRLEPVDKGGRSGSPSASNKTTSIFDKARSSPNNTRNLRSLSPSSRNGSSSRLDKLDMLSSPQPESNFGSSGRQLANSEDDWDAQSDGDDSPISNTAGVKGGQSGYIPSYEPSISSARAGARNSGSTNSNNNNSFNTASTKSPSGFDSTPDESAAKQQNRSNNMSANSNNTNNTSSDKSKDDKEKDDNVDMGGFMPSFLEPGRQARRRR